MSGVRANAQGTHSGSFSVSEQSQVEREEKTKQKGTQVTLVVKDSSLSYVLSALAKQTKQAVIFNNTNPLFLKRVSVNIQKQNLSNAITTALKGTGLTITNAPDGETLIIRENSDSLTQNRTEVFGTIGGRITDSASGKGVGQVVVSVNGTKLSVTSQENGNFRIANVPMGRHIVSARLLGYAAKTVNVVVDSGKMSSVVIVLRPMPTALSEVVTTATGRQRRVEVGNDITRINADSVMNVAPVATVTDLLATRVPGLIVMPTSGLPGAPSRLRLRGTSSMSTSNDPIVIVDGVRIFADQSGNQLAGGGKGGSLIGVATTREQYKSGPSPIDQLDPNSVESIEVFKGPSASALYGPDAANGVILITTKRGLVGPARVHVTLNAGQSALQGKWPVNYYRFGHVYHRDGGNTDEGVKLCLPFEGCVTDSLIAFQALNNSRFSPLETGVDRGASIGVSGGGAAMNYSVLGSATSRNGMMHLADIEVDRFRATHGFAAPDWMRQPDKYTTYSGTSNIGLRIGQHGDALLTNTVFYSAQQQPPEFGNAIRLLSTMYLDPRYLETSSVMSADQRYAFMKRVTINSLRSMNAVKVTWQPLSWLPVTANAGLDLLSTNVNSVLPRGYALDGLLNSEDSTGSYGLVRSTTSTRTLNVSTVFPVPRAKIATGFNFTSLSNTDFSALTSGLPPGVLEPTQFVYPNGTGPTQSSASRSTFGWYVAPTFRLIPKLFFNPGLRIDGSGATGIRTGLFAMPKLDFSWLAVDRLDQSPLFGVLTQLRPRVSFGDATVQPDVANTVRLFTPNSYTPFGTTAPVTGAYLSHIGNTKLRPERSREFEGGLDGDLWHSRVTFTLSGYHKQRYNAIVALGLAPSAGGQTIAENVGTIRNRGINASIDVRLLDSRSIEWRVGADVTRNRGMVISLVDKKEQVVVGGGGKGEGLIVYRPGYPPNAVFVPRIASYFDANQDGLISKSEIRISNDSSYMGTQEPTDQVDLRTTIGLFHNRLQISTAITYQYGLTQRNEIGLGGINALNDPSIPLARMAEIVAGCTNPTLCGGLVDLNNSSQIGAYQTVNLLRWNTLSIGYHLPVSVAHRVGGTTLSVALQGSNLGLRTNYRGKDPSVNSYTSGNLVKDSGQLPPPRIVQVRVQWGR